jgi:hypothetical protein
MGEIAINPTHNVFKKYKEVIYVNPYLMTAPKKDISTGLVSYYKIDEVSETLFNDSFGGQHLTNDGIVINQSGKVGASAMVTANGPKAITTTALPITGNFTLNFWVYLSNYPPGTNIGIIDNGMYTDNTGFGFWMNSAGQLGWRINGNYGHYTSELTIPLNTWTMVTYTYNGAFVKVYLNTVTSLSVAYAINPGSSTKRVLFNRGDLNGGAVANMRLDEVSFYNIALSQTDIDTHYNGGTGMTI